MSVYKWISILLAVIIVLALAQWYMVSRPSTDSSQNVIDTATTTTQNYSTSTPENPQKEISSSTKNSDISQNNNSVKNFMHTVTIETSKGTVVFETYDADAPNTVKNFITLANKGFYNGLIFHRVIDGFMIQGGDPTGTGMGGPGYKFADELNPNTDSYKTGYVRGTVAMANSGANTNGSQFFIMQSSLGLEHKYSIFGKVIKGLDIVDVIAKVPRNEDDRPLQDVVMKKVTVTENK